MFYIAESIAIYEFTHQIKFQIHQTFLFFHILKLAIKTDLSLKYIYIYINKPKEKARTYVYSVMYGYKKIGLDSITFF